MGNPFSYEAKRVVVTGAYSGVGAALVELLAELGAAHITVLDIKKPAGPVDLYLETNLGDEAAVRAAIDEIVGPVDVLFNNAGVAATQPRSVVMSVNYLALRTLSERLLEKIPAGGAIANTASIAGGQWPAHLPDITELLAIDGWEESLAWVEAHPDLTADPYSFSKECVQVYTMRSSRTTMTRHVRINSVCPAPIDTPLLVDFNATMTEKVMSWTVQQSGGTIATPMDIARALAFLGADASSYVNGVNLNVDGGFTAGLTTGQLDFSGLA